MYIRQSVLQNSPQNSTHKHTLKGEKKPCSTNAANSL